MDIAVLLLSSRCNLACAYCYQQARVGPPSMSWQVAKASINVLLKEGAARPLLQFSGGEPLLEPRLLEQCLIYLRGRAEGQAVRPSLTTNGTLLTPHLAELLVEHDVALQVSFDGAAAAQDRRGAGTFGRLLDALSLLRDTHLRYFADQVEIRAGLLPSTVGTVADSCAVLLELDAQNVKFYPVMGHSEACPQKVFETLCAQMERVVEESIAHWRRTGSVPVAFLRQDPGRGRTPDCGLCCSAGKTSNICVDTAGHAWSCVMFASSVRALSRLGRTASEVLDLGDIRDPSFPEKLAALPAKAAELLLLTRRGEKRSSAGTCRDCELLGECFYCPAATAYLAGNDDPHRVDDFACAFTRASAAARRSFHKKTGGAVLAAQKEDLRRALLRLTGAVRRDLESPP